MGTVPSLSSTLYQLLRTRLQVAPNSPAAKAGLEAGDVIVGMDGKEIVISEELIRAIHTSEIEQQIEITFWRGEAKNTTEATLAESPPP